MESNNNTNTNPNQSTPYWKIVCATLANFVLACVTSSILYVLWLIINLPNFGFLWLIMFVISDVILKSGWKRYYGTTLGDKMLRIKPSDNQTNIVTLILLLICVNVIFVANIFNDKDNTVENDYYEISVPKGWNAECMPENKTLYGISMVSQGTEKLAYFMTVNYDTSGIPIEVLANMVLGGMNRAAISDLDVKEIEFQNQDALQITGKLNEAMLEVIVFLSPLGKLSYIMAVNMSEGEVENLLSNVHLKNIQTPFADFDEVWNQFYGKNEECAINQSVDDGIILEGWKYDKQACCLYLNLVIDSAANDIKTLFEDPENKELFINDISNGQIFLFIAKNYNKHMFINIKDMAGDIVLTLPCQ